MFKLLTLIFACWLIASCQTPTKPEKAPVVQALSTEQSTARLNDAIAELGKGKPEAAQEILSELLRTNPDLSAAKDLLQQIVVDPVEYLGKEHFIHHVKRGDTIGKLASQYLHNATKFYILSRYNGIKNPSKIHLGQALKIPGVAPKTISKKNTRITKIEKRATTLFNKKLYNDTIKLIESQSKIHKFSPKIKSILLKSYEKEANFLEAKGQYSRSLALLEKGKKLSKTSTTIPKHIKRIQNKLHAQQLYANAKIALEKGDQESALEMLSKSVNYDPSLKGAVSDLATLKVQLTENYHKSALQKFRNQDLNAAVKYWKKVLEIDPQHKGAKSYLDRSLKMRSQLQQL